MQNGRVLEVFPDEAAVIEASRNPITMLDLGQPALDYVLRHHEEFEEEWTEALVRCVARLRDAMTAQTGLHAVASELFLELRNPVRRKHVTPASTEGQARETAGPPKVEAEAWAWGVDLAYTAKRFSLPAAGAVLAALSFATILYGLDSPTPAPVIAFSALGGLALGAAAGLLGHALYAQHLDPGHVEWSRRVYYIVGGAFLAAGIALGVVIRVQSEAQLVSDAAPLRLALLAATAVGLMLSGYGTWPIARAVIVRAEAQRRLDSPKYSRTPRLLLAGLPLLTGIAFFFLNWLVFQ